MTDAQTWRIQQLEKQVEELESKVASLQSFLDQFTGMSKFAQFSVKIIIALLGLGALNFVVRIFQWLNGPMKLHP